MMPAIRRAAATFASDVRVSLAMRRSPKPIFLTASQPAGVSGKPFIRRSSSAVTISSSRSRNHGS